jgi:thiol-disulfide isomerase/thioredoxin
VGTLPAEQALFLHCASGEKLALSINSRRFSDLPVELSSSQDVIIELQLPREIQSEPEPQARTDQVQKDQAIAAEARVGRLAKEQAGQEAARLANQWEHLLGDRLAVLGRNRIPTKALTPRSVVALYFSAHWCPPCRGFTPQLIAYYSAMWAQRSDFEIVFVSRDRDQQSFDEYFATMPWLAVPFEDQIRRDNLAQEFGVQGIPALVLLDANGKFLSDDGRSAVMSDPQARTFPGPCAEAATLSTEVAAVETQAAVIAAVSEHESTCWCCASFELMLRRRFESSCPGR